MITVSWFATKKCNFSCGNTTYGCVAGCQRHGIDTDTEPSLSKSLEWINKFTPGAAVHITGGEPFMRLDIRKCIEAFIVNGNDVAIHTNASLLPENSWAYNLPVKWLLTHHPDSIGCLDFLKAIAPLRSKPHIVSRIFGPGNYPDDTKTTIYHGYNFVWREAGRGFRGVEEFEATGKPGETLILIGQDGRVHPCSTPSIEVGNINNTTFNRSALPTACCIAWPRGCGTLETARLMESLG